MRVYHLGPRGWNLLSGPVALLLPGFMLPKKVTFGTVGDDERDSYETAMSCYERQFSVFRQSLSFLTESSVP